MSSGALIIDLQTRGTMAYEHWGIPSRPSPFAPLRALLS